MQPKPTTIEQYLEQLPADRKPAIEKLRAGILENLPDGFTETFSYGMIDFVVPNVILPRSLEKIARMYKSAIDNGFASFAEA
jgi:hypothetical protein